MTSDTQQLDSSSSPDTHHHETPYEAHDCFEAVAVAGGVTAGFGVFWASIRMFWNPASLKTSISRSLMNHAGTYGAIGAVYGGSACMLTRIRHKDDMWSSVFGGAMAGVALGLRARSFAVMAGSSSLLAGVMVLKGLAGNSILGPVGEMNPQQRKKWNEGFWSKPEYVPGRKMLEGKQG